ncbi:uncharacterized protein BX663DRAFT_269937 [Cokeromyces recurvatus]|uniref:uncharacterized protein n=2 Tax=Cokeromyces recurvatus TaxID=90255 RepID=UPI00221E7D61|nr:uncharacterized protein BX663DRAFT_269937 [Cokeromyces recurvatus]KAI7898055.1 hypothetical protein BX663DRAFT_269937 [Cokeromyces recurvatus]
MLEFYKCDTNIEKKKTFDAIAKVFRGIGDVPDRDRLKIKLFKIYKKAEKEDRKVIDILINLLNKLPNEETINYTIEEEELINNFVDPILSPLLHRPEKEKHFLWLNKIVTKSYNTRPDAGCALIHERRIQKFSCFAEVKAEYKKKDTLSTHQDLLRLALFGINEIENNNAKCILLVQVIGAVIIFYGCTSHTNGPKIIFEISKIKIPLSIQDLPGFIMKLDKLKKLNQFYNRFCAKICNVTNNMKRKSTIGNVDLDKIINIHKPKNLRVSIDF